MSLFAALGLSSPKHLAKPGASAPPAASPSGAPNGQGVHANKGKVSVDMDGEIGTVKVVKLSLGAIRWQGHQGQLLAFTDAAGKLVTGGPRVGWRAMGSGNLYGGRIVHALADLDKLEHRWRAESDHVKQGTVDGQALLKKVAGAMVAVQKRKATDDKFRDDTRAYFAQLSALPPYAEQIAQADAGFEEALAALGAAVRQDELEKVEEKIQETDAEIKAIQAEAQAVKDIVAKVLQVGTMIQSFAVAPDATKAIGMITEGITAISGVIIDGQYSSQLAILDIKLQEAQGEFTKLKHEKAYFVVQQAQAHLKQAVSKCKEADLNFRRQVDEMLNKRATAQDRSGESKDTRVVGEAIARRAQQRQLIFELRKLGTAYLTFLKPLAENIPKIRDRYTHVGDWVDDIAVGDSRLGRDSPWGKAAEYAGNANAYELGNWMERVQEVRNDCQKVLKEVEEAGANAAMAPYDQAMELIKQALATSNVK